MRLDELVIERYGPYEYRQLKLDGPGLTVVYGPNEAGKSTCLAAVSDFLFRIPERSARAAIFGADQVRLGATLCAADGRRIAFRRRSGRGRTLIDAEGKPCDDEALAPLLGATTRDRFEHLFGLNHESLREGGDQLLRADGDIGRLIVEAGGGLRTLMSRLDALDVEIDGLFAPTRKASRLFYKALDAYEGADKAARAATLTRDAYERDRKAHDGAAVALHEARRSKHVADEDMSRLKRAERVIPTLRAIDEIEAMLAGFDDVIGLPEDWAERWAGAAAEHGSAADEWIGARERLQRLSARLAAMVVDADLAAAHAAMLDIEERVTEVTGERLGRANRDLEISAAEAQLASLRDRLAVGPETDLGALIPTDANLKIARALAAEALGLRPRLEAARQANAFAHDSLAAARARMAVLAERGRQEPFGLDAARFSSLPTELRGARAVVEQSEKAGDAQNLRAAALGVASLDDLRRLVCPGLDQVRIEIKAREELSSEATRQLAARASAESQRGAAAAEIERLRLGGEIATVDALVETRIRRGVAWAPIKAAHLAGRSDGMEAERADQVTALEAAVADADRLSDNRVTEAERVAGLLEASRRFAEAGAAATAAEDAGRRIAERLDARAVAFAAAFPDARAVAAEPPTLLAFLESRLDILVKADAAEARRLEAEQVLERLAPAIRDLELAEARAGLSGVEEGDLTERVRRLSRAIAAHDRDFDAFQRESQGIARLESDLAAARRALTDLGRDQQARAGAWRRVADSVTGLAPDASPEDGDSLAVQWTAARGELRSLGLTKRRLARMDENERDLRARVAATAAPLGLAMADDAVAGGRMLVERWRANQNVQVARETLRPDLADAETTLASRQAAVERAAAFLGSLALVASVRADDVVRLTALADRQRELARLRASRAQLIAQAAGAGDGLSLAVLREEARDRDIDAARADIADLQDHIDTAQNAIERAIREMQQASDALRIHEGPSERARAVAQRESAAAEMGAAVERYVELKLARELVRGAVDKVRGEQQDPLIRMAGDMFSRMTLGEFDSIAADVDGKGAPVVVGVRPGGRNQSVATMSDGTRDQLFLAFRLASLGNYCRATEPLPFIADDILVHFDDVRAEATLALLADFCATTQVLLFTHHESVRSAAKSLAAEERANIVDL